MQTNYKKLWKMLIDLDMTRTELRTRSGISSSSLAKLGKGERVTTAVLLKVCETLNCDLSDIMPSKDIATIKTRKRTDDEKN